MKKIRLWFEKGATALSLLYVVPLVIIGKILYGICAVTVAQYLPGSEGCSSYTATPSEFLKTNFSTVLTVLTLEELIFRAIPILVVQWILKLLKVKNSAKIFTLLVMVAISSITFGYLHGNYLNIFIQGVAGLVYCLIFLKYGGYIMQKKEREMGPVDAFYVCFAIHLGFDYGVAYIF